MVWGFIMRYLANNEHLIEKLAQSPIMRRAAQLTVYFTLKSKAIGEKSFNDFLRSNIAKEIENTTRSSTSKVKAFSDTFSSELKNGLKNMQENLKKKN